MDKKRNIAISTAVSVGVYLFLLFSILDYASVIKFSSKKIPSKSEVFIDITAIEVQKKELVKEEKTEKPIENTRKEQKKILAAKNIKSLFDDANITFDEKNLFKNDVTIETRKKAKPISVDELFERKPVAASITKQIVKKLEKVSDNATVTFLSTDGVSDEYFEKVQQAVSNGWNPKVYQKGMLLTVIIKIETTGKFDYYIKKTTGDEEFLSMLKKHMQQLQLLGLPKPEKKISIEINFIAKG